jgi:hypothetical protein
MAEYQSNIKDSSVKYIRLLKPSFVLYLLVGLLIYIIVSAFVYFILNNVGTIIVISIFFGLSPLVFVKPIAYMIARTAESKGCGLSYWFVPDVEREKKHYGPLRANRLFGHPLGRKKWF